MTKASVTKEINNHRLMEGLTVFCSDFCYENESFWIISIHMENRRSRYFSHIRRIGRSMPTLRIGCKTNLVINNKVYGTSHTVSFKTSKAETFSHDTLTSKCRIPMDKKRQNMGPRGCIFQLILLGPNFSENHRVYDL